MTVTTDLAGLKLNRFIRSGDHIVWGQACGEPTTLIEALLAQVDSIGKLSAFAATSFSGILDAAAAEKLNLSSMGAIGTLRTVAAAGRLGIVPCHVSQIGSMIEQGLIGCEVALVQVSAPDAGGNLWGTTESGGATSPTCNSKLPPLAVRSKGSPMAAKTAVSPKPVLAVAK